MRFQLGLFFIAILIKTFIPNSFAQNQTEGRFCFECTKKTLNIFTDIQCEIELKQEACKGISKKDLKSCKNLTEDKRESGIGDIMGFIGRCAKGLFDSAKDILEFVWLALKTIYEKSTHPIETFQESFEHVESVKVYLSTEYDRAYDKATFPKTVRAGLAIASSVLKKVYNSVEEYISETYTEFKCLNGKARSEMMCNLIGDFIIPPVAALNIFKYGVKSLKNKKLKKFDSLNNDSNKYYSSKYNLEPIHLVNEKYKDVKQRYTYLINNKNGSDFFHGSNSASLISSIKKKEGLVPTGMHSDIPFSGEVSLGVSKRGVNQNTISSTRLEDVDMAVDYARADFNTSGWSVKASKECIQFLKKLRYKHLPGCNRKIEKRRMEQWKKTDRKDRELISKPFPVLYGVKPRNSKSVINNSFDPRLPEIGLKNGVSFNEIKVIFVPKNKIKFIQKMLGKNTHIKVKSLERATKNHIKHSVVVENAKELFKKNATIESFKKSN